MVEEHFSDSQSDWPSGVMTFVGTEIFVSWQVSFLPAISTAQSMWGPIFGFLHLYDGPCEVKLPIFESLSLSHLVLFHKIHTNGL